MKNKVVEHTICPCGKRGFAHERLADKAMGRAQAKRLRRADASGTRRGTYVENRSYECDWGSIHLTAMSRRAFSDIAA